MSGGASAMLEVAATQLGLHTIAFSSCICHNPVGY